MSARLDDLMLDQILYGLDEPEADELRDLLGPADIELLESLEQTAALVQVSLVGQSRALEPMPRGLRDSLMLASGTRSAPQATNNVVDIRPRRNESARETGSTSVGSSWLGWAVAAGFALALVVVQSGTGQTGTPDLAAARAGLLASAQDAITVPWNKTESGYEGVSGDVVWSDADQAGYMRLAGLPANDPQVAQYQLWIIDPERGAQPVDGGVFDVSGSGEVVVPIDAKLQVDGPLAFAITLEQPGGVVVSEGPLLVVAAVGS